ncbi:MAG: adenosylcobinamide-phosphate synthase CbiB [Candidatus Scalindua sp.]|nr:adenosylcobinamide-phosphate synthase CbiB [Candidatus Scalindua sp.]
MYTYLALQIGIAFLLDLIIGDPRWFPHPVRLIGKGIELLEMIVRWLFGLERFNGTVSAGHVIPDRKRERLAGIVLTGAIVFGTYFITYEIVSFGKYLGQLWEVAVGAIIIYFSLSTRDLLREARGVLHTLKSGRIVQARENLSRIVGRDTGELDEEKITRACVETIAENSVDGIIAPIFYAVLGGPALVMAYKAINTLDSMVGYKNAEYLHLGWASARFDDIVNFLPARLAAILLPLSAWMCGASFFRSIRIIKRDGQKHPSPNSGIPEAAVAGALGIRLGGTSSYRGVVTEKPFIGDEEQKVGIDHIRDTANIVFVASVLSVSTGIIALLIVSKIIQWLIWAGSVQP